MTVRWIDVDELPYRVSFERGEVNRCSISMNLEGENVDVLAALLGKIVEEYRRLAEASKVKIRTDYHVGDEYRSRIIDLTRLDYLRTVRKGVDLKKGHLLMAVEADDEEYPSWDYTMDGRAWDYDIVHPDGCPEKFCPILEELNMVGSDALGKIEDWGEPSPPFTIPIELVIEGHGEDTDIYITVEELKLDFEEKGMSLQEAWASAHGTPP